MVIGTADHPCFPSLPDCTPKLSIHKTLHGPPSSAPAFQLVLCTVTTVIQINPRKDHILRPATEEQKEKTKKETRTISANPCPPPPLLGHPLSTGITATTSTTLSTTITTSTTQQPWVPPPDPPRSLTTALHQRLPTARPILLQTPTSQQAPYAPAWTCPSPAQRSSAA